MVQSYLLGFCFGLFLLFVFILFVCFGCTSNIGKFLSQGSNLNHSCNLPHRCGNARSLTLCALLGIEPEPHQWPEQPQRQRQTLNLLYRGTPLRFLNADWAANHCLGIGKCWCVQLVTMKKVDQTAYGAQRNLGKERSKTPTLGPPKLKLTTL